MRLHNTINFVYIDGDHSPEQVYKDAVNMLPKMKSNGIILFYDYRSDFNQYLYLWLRFKL
jgi:hypothetical protein